MLPNFLIIGAQKSGTTSLAESLRAHPDVFLPKEKEAHHFGTATDKSLGGDSYRNFFRGRQGEPHVGEATPNYLSLPKAPLQIFKTLPDVKLIVALRNPIERAYSAYWHALRVGAIHLSFEEEFFDIANLRRQGSWSPFGILQHGLYHRHLMAYRKFFRPDQFYVFLFEDFIVDPTMIFDGLATFIGLGKPPLVSGPKRNQASRSRLPIFLRPFVKRSFPKLHRKNLVPFTPPPMCPSVRSSLSEFYRIENEKLGDMLNVDLSHWI